MPLRVGRISSIALLSCKLEQTIIWELLENDAPGSWTRPYGSSADTGEYECCNNHVMIFGIACVIGLAVYLRGAWECRKNRRTANDAELEGS